MSMKKIVKLAAIPAVAILAGLGLISCAQSRLIYFPRPYEKTTVAQWRTTVGGRTIDYETSQGKQRAFLQGNLTSPRNLWIFCGGNGTIALDWADWLKLHAPKQDTWLLIDYPGYGDCSGSASPSAIRESIRTVVPEAAKQLGWSGAPAPERLRFFGHSLGAAAALIGASEFGIQRGVILTPFTSTMDMAGHMTKLPVGFLVYHRFDNEARLRELAARGPGSVIIFHGTDDEAIPVEMGRKLAEQQKDIARLIEIPGGMHNTLQETNAEDISRALEEIGR